MRSIELFAGTGGLALGLAKAGFEHSFVADWDRHACATLLDNKKRVPEMADWDVIEADVRQLKYPHYEPPVSLLAAGAPCQPFSLGGKHRGDEDSRTCFLRRFERARSVPMPSSWRTSRVSCVVRFGNISTI